MRRGIGGNGERLTERRMVQTAGPGTRWLPQIDGEVAGGRMLRMSSGTTLQGSRGRMGWCRRRIR